MALFDVKKYLAKKRNKLNRDREQLEIAKKFPGLKDLFDNVWKRPSLMVLGRFPNWLRYAEKYTAVFNQLEKQMLSDPSLARAFKRFGINNWEGILQHSLFHAILRAPLKAKGSKSYRAQYFRILGLGIEYYIQHDKRLFKILFSAASESLQNDKEAGVHYQFGDKKSIPAKEFTIRRVTAVRLVDGNKESIDLGYHAFSKDMQYVAPKIFTEIKVEGQVGDAINRQLFKDILDAKEGFTGELKVEGIADEFFTFGKKNISLDADQQFGYGSVLVSTVSKVEGQLKQIDYEHKVTSAGTDVVHITVKADTIIADLDKLLTAIDNAKRQK